MNFLPLSTFTLDEIAECFNEAFKNYFVKFEVDGEYLENRWKGARVDLDLSFGIEKDEQLIAFIITGIDTWDGILTAHNAGTGVLPSYRGRGFVGAMYGEALPIWRRMDISQCNLEVITQNASAIHAYEKAGMHKVREVACFSGNEIYESPFETNDVKILRKQEIEWVNFGGLLEYQPCWEHVSAVVRQQAGQYEAWEARIDGLCLAYLVAHRATGAVLQFGFKEGEYGEKAAWELFGALFDKYGNIKVNNIDLKAKRSIAFLEALGLENTINQYEMRMRF